MELVDALRDNSVEGTQAKESERVRAEGDKRVSGDPEYGRYRIYREEHIGDLDAHQREQERCRKSAAVCRGAERGVCGEEFVTVVRRRRRKVLLRVLHDGILRQVLLLLLLLEKSPVR